MIYDNLFKSIKIIILLIFFIFVFSIDINAAYNVNYGDSMRLTDNGYDTLYTTDTLTEKVQMEAVKYGYGNCNCIRYVNPEDEENNIYPLCNIHDGHARQYVKSGTRTYSIEKDIIGSMNWIYIDIHGGNLTSGQEVSQLKLNFEDGYSNFIENAINDGYIEPLVLLDSTASSYSYVFDNILNIRNGGSTGVKHFANVEILFKPKKSKFSGVTFYANKNYSNTHDGLYMIEYLNFDVSLDSIILDENNPTGVFSPSSSELTNNDVIVTFDPDDEGSGIDYYNYSISFDNGDNYGSEITINGDVSQDIVLSDSGNIKIKAVVYDKAGNYSTLYSGTYKIDKDGPSKPKVSKESGIYKEEIEVEIVKGDDDTSEIYYTLDESIPTKDSNLYINKIKIDGTHNEEIILKVVSYDDLSNKSTIVEKYYTFNKELLDLKENNKKYFKYYVGLNKRGLMKVMLVSKTGKDLDFDKSDILEIDGCFKDGIIYIDENGEFRKYK